MNTLELIRQCYTDFYELLRVQILMLLLYRVNALTLILAFLSLKCPLLITSADYIQVHSRMFSPWKQTLSTLIRLLP